jgi:ABC-type transporter Mla subunit MlaD
MPIERWTDDQLDSLARSVGNLVQATERVLSWADNINERFSQILDSQLAVQSLVGQVSQAMLDTREETRQLKRVIDYLLSRDGENGSSSDRPQ